VQSSCSELLFDSCEISETSDPRHAGHSLFRMCIALDVVHEHVLGGMDSICCLDLRFLSWPGAEQPTVTFTCYSAFVTPGLPKTSKFVR
jgi:hypothetical protein